MASAAFFPFYRDALHATIGARDVIAWINEALMAVFFPSIGLEIKRELLHGPLPLAFGGPPAARDDVKIGVLLGSLASAIAIARASARRLAATTAPRPPHAAGGGAA